MAIEEMMPSVLTGGALGAIIAAGVVVILAVVAAFYVYTSFAWMTLGKKLKYKYSWLAWVPLARTAMILQLGGFHWAWVFLYLIPVFGWLALFVLAIIAEWKIFEKRKYPGWLALVPLGSFIPGISPFAGIASLIILGFVAWKDNK